LVASQRRLRSPYKDAWGPSGSGEIHMIGDHSRRVASPGGRRRIRGRTRLERRIGTASNRLQGRIRRKPALPVGRDGRRRQPGRAWGGRSGRCRRRFPSQEVRVVEAGYFRLAWKTYPSAYRPWFGAVQAQHPRRCPEKGRDPRRARPGGLASARPHGRGNLRRTARHRGSEVSSARIRHFVDSVNGPGRPGAVGGSRRGSWRGLLWCMLSLPCRFLKGENRGAKKQRRRQFREIPGVFYDFCARISDSLLSALLKKESQRAGRGGGQETGRATDQCPRSGSVGGPGGVAGGAVRGSGRGCTAGEMVA